MLTRSGLVVLAALLSGSLSAGRAGVEVGDPAPDFELRDAAGRVFRLADYRGKKPVVLEFFRSGSW